MKPDVTDILQRYLEAHSIKVEVKEQALVAENMVLSARVFEKPSSRIRNLLQLDINVHSSKFPGRTLIESFAAWGDSEEEAINSALEKFAISSLHVLLDVFAGKRNDEQTEWEQWADNGEGWQVCMGPLFISGFGESEPPDLVCGELIDRLRDKLLSHITKDCHWLRFYYMQQDGIRVGSECLLDNTPWLEGQAIVDKWGWPEGSYSARLFLMMLPETKKNSALSPPNPARR